jgi:putative RNA 2'-phosphotransferase
MKVEKHLPNEDISFSRIESTELSRALSHALRHEPWLYEIELDDEGWAHLETVAAALRRQQSSWANLTAEHIRGVVNDSTKRRHEIVDDRIRALYGHSLPNRLRRTPAEPPIYLFHGTARKLLSSIQIDGLLPMKRQYVHLSIDGDMAARVGQRKDEMPIVLQILAGEAFANGIAFYHGNEHVWLADCVPSRFIVPPAVKSP